MFVNTCVCECIVYACVYAGECVCILICMVCGSVCMYINVCMCMCVYLYVVCICVWEYTTTCVYLCSCEFMCLDACCSDLTCSCKPNSVTGDSDLCSL